MAVKFDPNNDIIQRCMEGMQFEDNGKMEEAFQCFNEAWNEASNDFERFIAAFHVARLQKNTEGKLQWMKKSLEYAQKIDDEDVKSAYPTLYSKIANYHEQLDNPENAQKAYQLSEKYNGAPTDKGPFFHGTKADLKVGDYLTAGIESNYKPGFQMNHIYFTANIQGAGLAATLAKGEDKERIYIVQPTGEFENDPNVTDKKFPGNLTRSYRSKKPLKIIDEATEWNKLSNTEREEWLKKLEENDGKIIN